MSKSYEAKYDPDVKHFVVAASKRDEKITYQSLVKSSMPHSSEAFETEVIGHTPTHILRAFNPVTQRPDPEIPSYDCKLKPDPFKYEIAANKNLISVEAFPDAPISRVICDCWEVKIVNKSFQYQKTQQNPYSVNQ